nr:Cna B-type domain-containing protein [Clostridia bacterium]
MRKNLKAILTLFCAIAMAIVGLGVPDAQAAVVDSLTVSNMFDSLGESTQYGVVAREWDQDAHAETNACVDLMDRHTNTVFSNTGSTYFHALGYTLEADVAAPQSLQGMTFALYKLSDDGASYVKCEGTDITIDQDVETTTLTWEIDSKNGNTLGELKNTRLFVMQVNNADGTYVEDGGTNEADLIVTYGPSVSASAYNSNYIGKMYYPKKMSENDSIGIFNTTENTPGIEFGADTRLYYKQEVRAEDGTISYEYVEIDPNDKTLNVDAVLVNYYYGDQSDPEMAYAKLDGIGFHNGVFSKSGNVINISYSDDTGRADSLLNDAEKYSQELANMGGGEITSLTPNPNGGSTVTGPVDEETGSVMSIYDVEIGEDGIFTCLEDMGWDGIPVAENEYVVVNLICPTKDGTVRMGQTGTIGYYYYEGQDRAEVTKWGSEDSNSSQRVIYNFVYTDENGILRPFEGTIIPNNAHGGTLLAPKAKVSLEDNVHNGSIIADSLYNRQETHQRSLSAGTRTTWVRMNGGYITLKKVSQGYNWNTGDWEDQYMLSDAVFGVYTDSNCTADSLICTMTTDKNGVATSELLPEGTYYVREIKAPAGHEIPLYDYNAGGNTGSFWPWYPGFSGTVSAPDTATVTVTSGGTVTAVAPNGSSGTVLEGSADAFINRQNERFNILAHKEDDLGRYVQGVVFGIYGDADCTQLLYTMTTNHNGVAICEDIPVRGDGGSNRNYWVKEVYAPDGYVMSEQVVRVTPERDQTVVVDGNGNADGNAFVNETVRGNMQLTKVDAEDANKKLKDAEFTIYTEYECVNAVGVMKTNAEGKADSTKIMMGNKEGLAPGTYYVKETKAPAGYMASETIYRVVVVAGEMVDVVEGGVIANEAGVHIKVEKNWKDKGEERPQFLNIGLFRNGEFTGQYIDLKSENGWKGEFKNLPKYDEEGNLYTYTLEEQNNGSNHKYFLFVENKTEPDGTLKVVMTNSIRKVNIDVRKQWTDNAGQWDNDKPQNIVYELYYLEGKDKKEVPMLNADGTQMTVTGNYTSNWTAQFRDLPLYGPKGEEPLTYLVKEQESGRYLQVENTGLVDQGGDRYAITFTNKAYTRVWGKKTWKDNNDEAGKRPAPEAVSLVLYARADYNSDPVKVDPQPSVNWISTEGNEWQWEFTGLEKGLMYSVKEEPVTSGYSVSYSGDAQNGYNITNTYTVTSITVKKQWSGVADDQLPESVSVQLYADNQKVEGKSLMLTAPDWAGTFADLPRKNEYNNDIQYTVKEEPALEGFRVSGDATKENNYTITNTAVGGELTLKKVDADNPSKGLPGAVFGVYSDQSCQNKVGEMTTDQNGEARLEVAPGTYWVREDKAPAGYTANMTGAVSVTVEKGSTATVQGDGQDGVFTNAQGKGKLYVKKVGTDSNSNNPQPLAGAEFTVYDDRGNVKGTMITNDQGYAEIELPVGNYQIKETKAPAGYRIEDNSDKRYQINNVGDSVQVMGNYTYNGEQGWFLNKMTAVGSIKLVKVSAADQNQRLSGAVFGVYSDQNCQTKIGEMTTDANGEATYANLEANRQYWVKEITAPEGYELNTQTYSVYVNANAENTVNGGNPVTNNVKQEKGSISLTKVSAVDANTKLSGAVFGVYSDENCTQEVGRMTTDGNGQATLDNLIAGQTYWVKEISAPSGYKLSDTKYAVTVVADTTTAVNEGNVITNEEQTGDGVIYLYKVATDPWGNNPSAWLAGAEFTVYKNENGQKGAVVGTMTTNADGYAELAVVMGQYIVVETKAPTDYECDTQDRQVQVNNIGDRVQVQGYLNYNGTNNCIGNRAMQYGTLEFVKYGANYNEQGKPIYDSNMMLLSGAEFTITANDGSYGPVTAVSDENGKVSLRLPAGKSYTVTETKAPNGYEMVPGGATSDSVYINTNQTSQVWWNSVSGDYRHQSGALINKKLEQQYGGFKFTKQGKNSAPLADVTFGVYSDEACTALVQTIVTGADGVVALTDLEAGSTYYIKEETAPAGYAVSETVYSVTIEAGVDDKLVGENGVITNTYAATGSITFAGTKSIDGRDMTEDDVFSFEITEGDTVIATVNNDAEGKIAYTTIAYTLDDVGTHTYVVKETSENGNGITVATNSYTVTVKVSDNGDGKLNVESEDDYTALDFVNEYAATG